MKLYKYCHPDRVDILQNRMIRFSQPSVLNDPFELSPYIERLASPEFIQELTDQVISELQQECPVFKGFSLSKMREALASWGHVFLSESTRDRVSNRLRNQFDSYGLLCLTEAGNDLLMWSHYADSHQGFAIEFDPANDFFHQKITEEDILRHLRKVSYGKNRPAINLSQETGENVFFTKGEEWGYEKEWRMLMPLNRAETTIETPGSIAYLFQFSPQAIRSIIFGCRIKRDTQDEILKVLGTKEMSHVNVYKSAVNQQCYKIDCIEFSR